MYFQGPNSEETIKDCYSSVLVSYYCNIEQVTGAKSLTCLKSVGNKKETSCKMDDLKVQTFSLYVNVHIILFFKVKIFFSFFKTLNNPR